jgi:hypothetical protein
MPDFEDPVLVGKTLPAEVAELRVTTETVVRGADGVDEANVVFGQLSTSLIRPLSLLNT